MANPAIFGTRRNAQVAPADTRNEAGGSAYAFSARHALAQLAATGCLNGTFYASAEKQLLDVRKYAKQVSDEYLARTALYARESGAMKDMPALLCVLLSKRSPALLQAIFHRVIDNGKMIRNFVQMMRSGALGRKSLGTRSKRLVQEWFARRSDRDLFFAMVGDRPSIADLIRLAHPKPATPSRAALHRWFLGYDDVKTADLPPCVRDYDAWKSMRLDAIALGLQSDRELSAQADCGCDLPDAPFLTLTGFPLSRREWGVLAERMPWNALRQSLNMLQRHGALSDRAVSARVAERLADADAVKRSKVFPYQILQTLYAVAPESQVPEENRQGSWWKNFWPGGGRKDKTEKPATVGARLPDEVRVALEKALDLAMDGMPGFGGKKVYVLVDVSGSMQSPVTGHRAGATTATRCVDVAALMAVGVLRRNPGAEVIPFESRVVPVRLDARDSVSRAAAKLAAVGGGGTNCSAPLVKMNAHHATGDLVIYLSDNESWVDSRGKGRGTATLSEWEKFKRRNPGARLVCVDLQPYAHTQACDRADILNLGGFSEAVFDRIRQFAEAGEDPDHWVEAIERIEL